MSRNESLLKFPCEFPVKALGQHRTEFDLLVVEIIRRHVSEISEGAVKSRLSSGGKYISVTVTIRAQSQQQLDAIYQDLTNCTDILMAL